MARQHEESRRGSHRLIRHRLLANSTTLPRRKNDRDTKHAQPPRRDLLENQHDLSGAPAELHGAFLGGYISCRQSCTTAQTAPATRAAPTRKSGPAGASPAASTTSSAPESDTQVQCDDDPDCGEAVQRALRQSDAKDYEAALKTYQAVYKRWPTPWLLINLGRVQQKIGRPAEAVVTYQRYLDTATNDKPERMKVARAFLAQARRFAFLLRLHRFAPLRDPVARRGL
jgi:tetratricopeptide (TPR) repeat protein